MTWTEQFADKVTTAADAAALVRDGDRVMCGLPEPVSFLVALGERSDISGVECYVPAPRSGGAAVAKSSGVELHTSFLTEVLRRSGAPAQVRPIGFSGWAGFARRWQPRIRVVTVAEPLADGTIRPGSSLGASDALVRERARPDDLVIGVVNPGQPQINGDSFKVGDFDFLIPLSSREPRPDYDQRSVPDEIDDFVGAIDELVPNGATLQAGVGGLAEEIMANLSHKTGLGIHTEVFGYGLCRLMESGAVTNADKALFPGQTVCTIALPETYDFAADNPNLRIEAAGTVLHPPNIASNPNVRCINSSIEVDLFGQSNAEMIGGSQFSGVGGQLDFLRACALSDDALAIQVLKSTTGKGQSRIVARLDRNAATGTRYDTHVVVTEYGVAWLRDATITQRAKRLIAVAHPDHRASLTEEAERSGLF